MKALIVEQHDVSDNIFMRLHGQTYSLKRIFIPSRDNLVITIHDVDGYKQLYVTKIDEEDMPGWEFETIQEIDIDETLVNSLESFAETYIELKDEVSKILK